MVIMTQMTPAEKVLSGRFSVYGVGVDCIGIRGHLDQLKDPQQPLSFQGIQAVKVEIRIWTSPSVSDQFPLQKIASV